jgi:hypothetical protein
LGEEPYFLKSPSPKILDEAAGERGKGGATKKIL